MLRSQSPNGRRTHSTPSFSLQQTSPSWQGLWGANSGKAEARGESVQQRADAAGARVPGARTRTQTGPRD